MKKQLLPLIAGTATLMSVAHPIDFGQIRHWTGSGPNEAALVVQFNGDTYGGDAYVWGYRWADGTTPTGEDMFKAICANSSRLSLLTQYTGSMGATVAGVGYSLNQSALDNLLFDFEKAKNFEFINFDYYASGNKFGQTDAPGDNAPAMAKAAIDEARECSHVVQHPFDYKAYGYPAYDYDCWMLADGTVNLQGANTTDMKWMSHWYEGYWSFWSANAAEQDFMYSGTGFTGRQLRNGAVDAWSFTAFDEPQVGGMGEGVAPCEDGVIVYMPERLVEGGVELSKATRVAGSGERTIPVVVSLGNPAKVDNVVYRYNFNDVFPDAATLISTIAAADPAFTAEAKGNGVTAIALDTNGDGAADVEAEGEWKLEEYEDALYLSLDPEVKPSYLFYLPAVGEVGAWLPESMTLALSDADAYIPVFVQPKAEHDALNYSFYRRADESFVHSSNSSDIIGSVGTGSTNFGKLTFKGDKVGDVYMHVRVRIGKGADYTYSNVCKYTLLPPEIPISSVSFAVAEVESALNRKIENAVTVLPENATFTKLVYSSSDPKVATASSTGAFSTTTTGGTAVISVASAISPEVNASFTVNSRLMNPVTDIRIKGVEGDVIVLNPKRMIGVIGEITPANADITDFDVVLEGTTNDKATMTASMYKVNYWDENNTRIQFYELSGHRVGECKLTLTAKDGTGVSRTYTVRVEEPDRTPLENGYTDGTIILNEEWFGHTNGGLNYITPAGEMIYQAYERENPGMSFGATSQYATIWAGKLIAASKQAVDGGDPLPGGGRLVVADASTLKRLGSLDDLMFGDETKSGDGRAVAGATPEKAYVGTTQGIYVVDLENIAIVGKVKGSEDGEGTLYEGQIGDMIHAGRYVFAIKQATGVFVIDTLTDTVIKTFADSNIQGVTQSADGNVWFATLEGGSSKFVCIDPETLEENEALSATMPAEIGTVVCSWGAWRTTPFSGCLSENTLWFVPGAGGITGGSGGKYYRWEIGSDPSGLQPVFDLEAAALQGSNSRVSQKTYGAPRYDDRSGELIVMTTENSSSGHYRYNWTHFIDPATGAIKRTIALEPYYWFQSMVLFPDRHLAEINLGDIELYANDGALEIDLGEHVTDPDNIDYNIKFAILDEPSALADEAEAEEVADISLEGRKLTVTPRAKGVKTFTLAAESAGRTATGTVAIRVKDIPAGIEEAATSAGSICCAGRRVLFSGLAGETFGLYDMNGKLMATIEVDNDSYTAEFGFAAGVYALRGDKGTTAKIVLN